MSIDWANFTPIASALGGALIGLAAVWMMAANGRIAGVSGMVHGALRASWSERAWRGAFLLGIVLGAALLRHLFSAIGTTTLPVPAREGFPVAGLVLAGLLVGAGTRLGSGCTSGHGICGIARRSPRSIVATLIFVGVAVIASALVRHVLGLLP